MRTLLSSPHFWGILTLLIAAAVIVGSVWILKYSYSLILPEDYGKLKNKFGTPLKSIDIMIKRVPLPEILCFLGIHYIHLNAPDTGKVDIYGDKIVFSAQNYALVINTKDPDFAKKVYIEQPYVTISNFENPSSYIDISCDCPMAAQACFNATSSRSCTLIFLAPSPTAPEVTINTSFPIL